MANAVEISMKKWNNISLLQRWTSTVIDMSEKMKLTYAISEKCDKNIFFKQYCTPNDLLIGFLYASDNVFFVLSVNFKNLKRLFVDYLLFKVIDFNEFIGHLPYNSVRSCNTRKRCIRIKSLLLLKKYNFKSNQVVYLIIYLFIWIKFILL